MKKQSILLLFFIFLTLTNYSNAGWEKIFDGRITDYARFISFDNIIIVAADSGVYRSTDSGTNWTFCIIDTSLVNPDSTIVPVMATMFCKNDQLIFASTNVGVYSSDDTGETWEPLGPFVDESLIMIAVFAKGSLVFTTMAGGGAFRSSNNGIDWTYLGPHRFYHYITCKDTLFAAAMDGLWFSVDLGVTWTLCERFNIYPMYISVYSLANTDTYMFADCWDRIYRSSDAGRTFDSVYTGLPFADYNVMGIYSVNNLLFANITNNRIYFSRDLGEHWEELNEGLDTLSMVNCFGILGEKILISKNRCLWSYDLNLLTEAHAEEYNPQSFELFQNFPNPFNPTTKIGYTIPQTSFVTLKVYDLLGREIKTLIEGEQLSGQHTVIWNGTNEVNEKVTSSIYFYKLEISGNAKTRKMILLK